MFDSRLSDRSSESAQALPKKEEWAIIYQQRAQQYQKAKSMEKLISQQKKDRFKNQLDMQLMQKNTLKKDEKAQDRKYYEYITSKAQQMKERQEKQKFKKFLMSKELEQQNRLKMQAQGNTKNEDLGKVYNIDIGLRSEMEKKERAQAIRKNVIATLDKQREQKDAEKNFMKQKELVQNAKNEEYQNMHYQNRSLGHKKYEQNQNVYNYYRDIYQQKARKDKDLEYKLVDNVQQKEAEQDIKRRERQGLQKQRRNLQMKDTLEKQLQVLHQKKEDQHKFNPQQANYSFISGIFRDKKPAYDKKEYSMFLDRQSEEQKKNKLSQKYMNEQEYRYNSNQLNKAITGSYTFDKYYDRSMNNIGDRLNISAADPLKIDDSDLVKTKLEVARSHHKPGRHIDRSASAFGPIS